MIGNDGIYCKGINGQSFKVQNTANGQKIYAKGLSNTKGTTGDGSLYVSGDFIDAFKVMCDELKKAFADVRFLGNNEEHSTNIGNALGKVVEKLDTTSIIATS